MAISDTALDLAVTSIFGSEGFDRFARLDTIAVPAVWTIGHGTTRINGQPVRKGMSCTRAQADQWAKLDMAVRAVSIERHITQPMSDAQFAAFLSLDYNIGDSGFAHSDVCSLFNAGQTQAAADAFLEYDHAGGRAVEGLENRRKRERALFLQDDAQPSAADTLNQAELQHAA